MLDDKPVRRLAWNACYNVRDLGGYETADGRRVRWRALLRADDLCRLTPEGQQALVTYGVRTIIDLRSPSEWAVAPHPFAAGAPCAPVHHALSLFDEEDVAAMAALAAAQNNGVFYCAVLDFFHARVGAVVRAVAEAPEGGVLVHCFAGKDRTGIVAALALALAGVPRETIAADYALSDSYLQPLYDELLAMVDDPAERERRALQYRSPPESILAVLDHLDVRHGGVAAYLRAAGVMDEQLERIRVRLVEGDIRGGHTG